MVEDNVFDLMRGRLVKGLQSASIGALAQKHWAPFLISICLPDFEYNDGDKRSAHRGRWDYMLSCEWLHHLKDLEAACFTKKEG